jgi:hypothetical protein
LSILDITGKTIYTHLIQLNGVTKTSFDFSNYARGIYFVKYTSGNDVTIKKLVIN